MNLWSIQSKRILIGIILSLAVLPMQIFAEAALSQDQLSVHYVSSEESPAYDADLCIDGNLATFWHTKYTGYANVYPDTIVFKLASAKSVTGVSYRARQDVSTNGLVKEYEILTSSDGVNYILKASGALVNVRTEQRIDFSSIAANVNYIKFVAKSPVNAGDVNVSMSEFCVYIPWNGSGTAADPWQITTAKELDLVRNIHGDAGLGKCFKLINDIDLTSYLAPGGEGYAQWGDAGWKPIGFYDNINMTTYQATFRSRFDGNSKKISGLWINRPTEGYVGLFGCSMGEIHNLSVSVPAGKKVLGDGANLGSYSHQRAHTAILLGDSYGGTVRMCSAEGTVECPQNTGLLVGFSNNGNVSNSYARGTIISSDISNTGSLIGYSTGSVTNCYAAAAGKGLIGYNSSSVSNSFWDSDLSGTAVSAGGTGKTTAEMKTQSTFTGWDFVGESVNGTADIWGIHPSLNGGYPYLRGRLVSEPLVLSDSVKVETGNSVRLYGTIGTFVTGTPEKMGFCMGTTVDPVVSADTVLSVPGIGAFSQTMTGLKRKTYYFRAFAVIDGAVYYGETISCNTASSPLTGAGTESNPWLITCPEELDSLHNYLGISNNDKHFKVMNDIDLTEYLASGGAGYAKWGASGWLPVGTAAAPFYGFLDGNNYAVQNMIINRPTTDNNGLFGVLSGSVVYLSVNQAGVIGRNNTGSVAGCNFSGTVKRCRSAGNVDGGSQVGGFIGNCQGTVLECFSRTNVTGSSNLGGFVGVHNTAISNSYCIADISIRGSGSAVGGFYGYSNGGKTDNCYSSCNITGNGTNIGGFFGRAGGSETINRCFYNGDKTLPANIATVFSASSSELKTMSTFTKIVGANNPPAWDFKTVWALNPLKNDGYPYFGTFQTIDFPAISNKTYGDPDFALTAHAQSELPVTYTSSDPKAAVVTGSIVKIIGAGTVTITASQSGSETYEPAAVSQTFTVHPKELLVTADPKTVEYAGDAELTIRAEGFVNGDDSAKVITGRLACDDRYSGVGVYPITIGTLSAGKNYAITFTGADYTVIPRGITITPNSAAKMYGRPDPVFTFTDNWNGPGNDFPVRFTGSLSREKFGEPDGENVGEYAVTIGTLSAGPNFRLELAVEEEPSVLTITPASIHIEAIGASKFYGETDPELRYSVFTGYEYPEELAPKFSGSLSREKFGEPDGENVGSYEITLGTLSAGNNFVHHFGNEMVGKVFLQILPMAVKVSADTVSKVYGTADPKFTYTITPAPAKSPVFTGSLTRTAGERAGTYEITQGTLNFGSNFTAEFVPAAFTITPAVLTADNIFISDKTYDGTVSAHYKGAVLRQIIAGDKVSLTADAAFESKSAGTNRAVTLSNVQLTGADAGNYLIDPAGLTASASIFPAPLYISDITASKVYDGTVSAVPAGGKLNTVLAGDNVSIITGTVSFPDRSAGVDKLLAVSGYGITGADAGNYILKSQPTVFASITPKPVQLIGCSADDKVYDGTNTAAVHGGELSGVIPGDNVTFSAKPVGFFSDPSAGSAKPVTVSGVVLGGTDASNYVLTNQASVTASILPAPLTVSGLSVKDKVYDGTRRAVVSGGVLTGIRGNDGVALSEEIAGEFDTKDAGIGKKVAVNSPVLVGNEASNYTLKPIRELTGTITPKPITVESSAFDKVYDGTASANVSGISLAGVIAPDAVNVSCERASFADKNCGTAKTVSLENVTLSGTDASNYQLTAPKTISASIAPASLTLTKLSAQNKTYDRTTAVKLFGGELSGVIGSDDVKPAGILAGEAVSAKAGVQIPVNVTLPVLTGADAANYRISSAESLFVTIEPCTLSVAGLSAADKIYDGTVNYPLAGGVLAGVLGADQVQLSGTIAGVTETADAGTAKTIFLNPLSLAGTDASNYTLPVQPAAVGNVLPRLLRIEKVRADKIYDGTTAAKISSADLYNVITGDQVSAVIESAQFSSADAGSEIAIAASEVKLAGEDAHNYRLDSVPALTGSIYPAKLTVTAKNAWKYIGQDEPAFSAEFTGFVPGETDTLVKGLKISSFHDEVIGQFPIVPFGASAKNYEIAYKEGTLQILEVPYPTSIEILTNPIAKDETELPIRVLARPYSTAVIAVYDPVGNRIGEETHQIPNSGELIVRWHLRNQYGRQLGEGSCSVIAEITDPMGVKTPCRKVLGVKSSVESDR